MRVVLDTNILISALLSPTGHPATIYRAWLEGHFELLTCAEQLDELRGVLHKPALAERIKPSNADRRIVGARDFAALCG
jgi:putative PIN family toxin of toxin-antitoxin system